MSDTFGIDLGTTSIKVARFDMTGRTIACAARGYHRPNEHAVDADRVFAALAEAAAEVAENTCDRPSPVAIGIASQTNSFALVDELGAPVTPVHLWTGDWAGDEARAIHQRFRPGAIARATGMTQLTGQFLAPKCLHLREHEPDAWQHKRCVWLLPDLVTHRLTGRAVTDPALWSLTGLYELDQRGWWTDMLDALELEPGALPELSWAGRRAGALTDDAAQMLHVSPGIPVAVGTLDHLAAAIAVGNTRPGCAAASTGTASCVVVTHDTRPDAFDAGIVGPHPANPDLTYALAWSGLSSTGLNWCAREHGGEHRLSDLLSAAGDVPPDVGGWHARPRDPNAGDAGFDFERDAEAPATGTRPTEAEAMRAVLECITSEMHRLLNAAAAGKPIDELAVIGGGARSDLWLDLLRERLGVTIRRPDCIEATALGAARLGALAAGSIQSLDG